MLNVIILNLVGVIALSGLIGLLAKEGVRGFATVWTFCFLASISFWVWVGYVIIHFIQKWW